LPDPRYRSWFSGSIIRAADVNTPDPRAVAMFGVGVAMLGLFTGLRRRLD
jgi:MYXO-CTERM domain-containing protein